LGFFLFFLYLSFGFYLETADHVLSRMKKNEENQKRTPSELTELTFFHISADPNNPIPSGTKDSVARHLGWQSKYNG